MAYYVYILSNKRKTVLYVGVTNDLQKRVWEHKSKSNPKSFTSKYNLDQLVYMEVFPVISDAIAREKQIKSGSRIKKIKLIESLNKQWQDLYYL